MLLESVISCDFGHAALQRMVQHALALKAGKTYKDVSETLAEGVKAEEPKGLLGKITGLFRST